MQKRVVSIIMLTIMISVMSVIPSVKSSSNTVFSVQPASIINPALGPTSTFRINLTVANVNELWSIEFLLEYDTRVLTATNAGLYLPFENFIDSTPEFNDVEGYVYIAAFTYIPDWVGLSTVDPKAVAWIEFEVDYYGTSTLHLCGPYGPDYLGGKSILGTWYGTSIPHVDTDGFFDNRPKAVAAAVDVAPDSLTLGSDGKWITAYIQLPEGYNPADIDAVTILLNDTISPVADPKYGFVTNSSEYLVDHNNDGVLERMVKFDRAAVDSWIYHTQGIRYGTVALTISGALLDGTPFKGTDAIFINYAGDANNDGKVNSLDIGAINANWDTNDSNADMNCDGNVNSLDIGIVNANWGQTIP